MENLKRFNDFEPLFEMIVEDEKLQKEIKEFAELSDQIEKANRDLKVLQNKHKNLTAIITPILEELKGTEDTILEVDKIIVKIKSKGYKRENYKYKEAMDWLKSRVNKKMQALVNDSLEANKGFSEVATKIESQRLSEGIGITAILDHFTSALNRLFTGILRSMKKSNKELRTTVDEFKRTLLA